MLMATKAGSDIVLSLDTPPAGGGWQLERQIMGGGWQVLASSPWASSSPLLFVGSRYLDAGLADGLYSYRATLKFPLAPDGEVQTTDWVVIGAEKVGWTFRNYTPAPGRFGEVLTADDLRWNYLWGIETTSSLGDFFYDEQIQTAIEWATRAIERMLKITIVRLRIGGGPEAISGEGSQYDEVEDAYAFRPEKWRRVGYLTLRRRPVLSLERLAFYSPVATPMMDLLPWARLERTKGVVRLYPTGTSMGSFNTAALAIMGISLFSGGGQAYPGAFHVDYTAGYSDASKIPSDLRDVIGKLATMNLLNLVGDGLIAGFSSSSLSMDGLSESFASTQSPENTYFGARIRGYQEDIKRYLRENRTKLGFMTIGSI